jgi:hypothetical protein
MKPPVAPSFVIWSALPFTQITSPVDNGRLKSAGALDIGFAKDALHGAILSKLAQVPKDAICADVKGVMQPEVHLGAKNEKSKNRYFEMSPNVILRNEATLKQLLLLYT